MRVRDWLVLLIYTPVARGGIGIGGGGGGMITWLQSRSVGRPTRNKGGNGTAVKYDRTLS